MVLVGLFGACGFEHGTAVQDDAPRPPDDTPGGTIDAPIDGTMVVVDAPPDGSTIPCSTTGLPCAGTPQAAICNGDCWVKCTLPNVLPNQDAAQNACTTWGGKLAPIRSQADQDCVEQTLFPGQASWIGFEQSTMATTPSNGWTWNSDGVGVNYTHWDTGQPNDANGNENDHAEQCAFMTNAGFWQDSQCGNAAFARFACTK